MCGIAGFADVGWQGRSDAQARLEAEFALVHRMCEVIRHRGPDDEGIHVEPGVGLGMRRLSIIDLAGGHQPIHNEDRTIWIVFNGEIYNYLELRAELEKRGHAFSTNSDTESIVHAYEEWGEEAFQRLRGMFGLAIWDSPRRTLMLARDRSGIKPLHYVERNGRLVFGSEGEQRSSRRHVLVRRHQHLAHASAPRRDDGGLQLHRFEDGDLLPGGDVVARLHQHLLHHRRHRREDRAALGALQGVRKPVDLEVMDPRLLAVQDRPGPSFGSDAPLVGAALLHVKDAGVDAELRGPDLRDAQPVAAVRVDQLHQPSFRRIDARPSPARLGEEAV